MGPRLRFNVGIPRLVSFHGILLLSAITAGAQSNPALQLVVSTETAPAGGTVQVKVWASSPTPIMSGRLFMYFDPSVFDKIAHVTAFSAAGDAYGSVAIKNSAIDLLFNSPSGGIGRLPDLPIFAVTASLRTDAARGANVDITLDPSPQPWKDPQGNTYSVGVLPGMATVGGTLSIQNVTPGGGILPAGTVVRIDGTGFNAATALTVDGVSFSNVQMVGPQQINFTLDAPAELTGKAVRVRNPDGEQTDYFSSLRAIPDANSEQLLAGGELIFPFRTYSVANPGVGFGPTVALQNSSFASIDVTFDRFDFGGPPITRTQYTVPPGGLIASTVANSKGNPIPFVVRSSSPIQMLVVQGFGGTLSTGTVQPSLPPVSQLKVNGLTMLTFVAQSGSMLQPPRSFAVVSTYDTLAFTVSTATTSGGKWLSATTNMGTLACGPCTPTAMVTVAADPGSLPPGTYSGTVTLTPTDRTATPLVLPVQLEVQALSIVPFGLFFSTPDANSPPAPQTMSVTHIGSPATVSAVATAESGGKWLFVTSAGITPATLRVSADPKGLAPGYYYGHILVQGAGDTQQVSVELAITTPPPLLFTNTASLTGRQSGPAPPPQVIALTGLSGTPATMTVTTNDGAAWLAAQLSSDSRSVTVMANPAGLAPGTYQGLVSVSSSGVTSQVRVTFLVLASPAPPLTVVPQRLEYTCDSTSTILSCGSVLTVTSGGIPTGVQAQASGLVSASVGIRPTPATVGVYPNGSRPGVYKGTVTITAEGQSVTVPVVASVVSDLHVPPVIGAVVSGASQTRGSIAPGEIITIHGDLVGPPGQYGLALDSSGTVATFADQTRVLFDGIPAPLLYASESQLNVIVPYEVAGRAVTTVEVEYYGTRSSPISIPVVPSAPAVFTVAGAGRGHAAVLNQDNSINSAVNAAARGSTIQIYATGEGLTSPPGITGSVTHSDVKNPVLPVSVTIGAVDAHITYAGSAPDSVAGLFQVNAVVPQGVAAGPEVPIVLTVGPARSSDGATIAIR